MLLDRHTHEPEMNQEPCENLGQKLTHPPSS